MEIGTGKTFVSELNNVACFSIDQNTEHFVSKREYLFLNQSRRIRIEKTSYLRFPAALMRDT